MGNSASASLRYGVLLGGGEEDWALAEYDKSDYDLTGSAAWITDADDFLDEAEDRMLASVGFTEEWSEETSSGFFDRKREAEKNLLVEIESFGTYDYSTYALVMKWPDMRVNWGAGAVIIPAVQSDWDEHLSRAAASLGITPTAAPGWILGAFYG